MEWTPGLKELLRYRYWPSTTHCQTLYSFDAFEAFAHVKVSAPSMSRHAFLKLLEHRSVQAGRPGNVCADTFQKSFFEYCFCKHTEEVMCEVNDFYCPACHPDIVLCCDGNRKHYRFKSTGNEEPSLYKGLFLAKDEEVSAFLKSMAATRADNSGTCGVSRFRASKETSKKSSSKIDEEGIQVAVVFNFLMVLLCNLIINHIVLTEYCCEGTTTVARSSPTQCFYCQRGPMSLSSAWMLSAVLAIPKQSD